MPYNHDNWGTVSSSIGGAAFIWMASEGIITSQAPMILTVTLSTLLIHAATEATRFRVTTGDWPKGDDLSTIITNTRDLGFKIAGSVAGFMTGVGIADSLGYGNLTKTLMIMLFDSLAVGIINLMNELPKCHSRADFTSTLLKTVDLMMTVAGAAAIWQQISLIDTLPRTTRAAISGFAIFAEFMLLRFTTGVALWNGVKKCCGYGAINEETDLLIILNP
ncbi:MAG: hypothetical protein COB66_00240 [Coxiella sp. (in: Bacteria)]|nr:MAG: hypothetical protein COB66_00240 [Coxiella sp. (in: g-proteobacteria)]